MGMFGWGRWLRGGDRSKQATATAADVASRLASLQGTQGVVEFSLDGLVLATNDVFLHTLGYRREEIVGAHHSVFVDEEESRSDAYIAFWRRLRSGLHDAGLYRRLGKDGKVVWIQATYNPIFDANGRPVKIVKYAVEMSVDMLAATPDVDATPVAPAMVSPVGPDGAVAEVLDLIDSVALRANALSMSAAIDAALAEDRGVSGPPAA